jgi:DNA-binding SARP family transcriptional activator
LRAAIDLYRGDLLPEEGPAEWVVEPRERYRLAAVDACISLAELAAAGRRWHEVVQASEQGLSFDRFDDRPWKLLIDAHQRAGDSAAAARATARYEELLEELGVQSGSDDTEPDRIGAARPSVVG